MGAHALRCACIFPHTKCTRASTVHPRAPGPAVSGCVTHTTANVSAMVGRHLAGETMGLFASVSESVKFSIETEVCAVMSLPKQSRASACPSNLAHQLAQATSWPFLSIGSRSHDRPRTPLPASGCAPVRCRRNSPAMRCLSRN